MTSIQPNRALTGEQQVSSSVPNPTATAAVAGDGPPPSPPQAGIHTDAATGATRIVRMNADAPCPRNETMLQAFEWYCPADRQHWRRLSRLLGPLAELGITSMWIPPAAKAGGGALSNGYDVYDLFDLGEFHQKRATETKWGGKQDLVDMVAQAKGLGIRVLFDAVLNHKAAADRDEVVVGVKVDPTDRRKIIGKPERISASTYFDFPGRGGVHSTFRWGSEHFTGIDRNNWSRSRGIWLFQGKKWADDVDDELGNYDYLMFADIDHSHPEVRREIYRWVWWLSTQLDIGGLRLDAIKHFSRRFVRDFVGRIDQYHRRQVREQQQQTTATIGGGEYHKRGQAGNGWFIVGEYWSEDRELLAEYINFMGNLISLFDVPLVKGFSRLSFAVEGQGDEADLRLVFQGTLCEKKPDNSVSFVVNHDTQLGQSLETPVAEWFLPLAYALILLRADAGLPCVFYGDMFGSFGPNRPSPPTILGGLTPPMCGGVVLPKLILARRLYAYGTQLDYFDLPSCIGFTRLGHMGHSSGTGLAVVLNSSWTHASKRLFVGKQHAGEIWTDLLAWAWGEVLIDPEGFGVFRVGPRSVAVWADRAAEGRSALDELKFDCEIYQRDTVTAPVTR